MPYHAFTAHKNSVPVNRNRPYSRAGVAHLVALRGAKTWGVKMVSKIAGLARLLATLLAIVAGFIAIPGLNVALVLVVLGLIAGLAYGSEEAVRLFLVVLVLPIVGA